MKKSKIDYEITHNPQYFNVLTEKMGYNELRLFDPVKKIDIRVDYSVQKTRGGAYKSAIFRLQCYELAILNDSYDAEIMVIRDGFIPKSFVKHFIREVKRRKGCYYVLIDETTSDSDMNLLVMKQAQKIYSDIENWKK